jgi:stage III sporulation protein AF
MTWMNGWIKELILIILVAAFTDLLLPSHALQRYVRTVIGLFLLLVLLSPLYELFHHRWNPNQWMQATLAESTANKETLLPLSVIVKQSNELKAANQKQAKQLLETQLALSMKDGIESQGHASVEKLQVSTQVDNNGKPTIVHVNVVLAKSSEKVKEAAAGEQTGQTAKPFIEAMKPVRPVVVDIQSKTDPSSNQTNQELKVGSDPRIDLVKQYIMQEWQLKTSQIDIQALE